jgi:hypothetical protein
MPGFDLSHDQIAHAFGVRLGHAMRDRGWAPSPSVLRKHFNRAHPGAPISFYTTRSWLRGQFLPRPDRLVTLAQCLGVAPHELMYGQYYQNPPQAREAEPALILSEREHRLVQCLRRLSPQGQVEVERTAWRCLAAQHKPSRLTGA